MFMELLKPKLRMISRYPCGILPRGAIPFMSHPPLGPPPTVFPLKSPTRWNSSHGKVSRLIQTVDAGNRFKLAPGWKNRPRPAEWHWMSSRALTTSPKAQSRLHHPHRPHESFWQAHPPHSVWRSRLYGAGAIGAGVMTFILIPPLVLGVMGAAAGYGVYRWVKLWLWHRSHPQEHHPEDQGAPLSPPWEEPRSPDRARGSAQAFDQVHLEWVEVYDHHGNLVHGERHRYRTSNQPSQPRNASRERIIDAPNTSTTSSKSWCSSLS
jgi:hypothetical protein